MASIIIAGDTSGAITLASPAVAGSNTLTLPSSTDTLVGKATTDTLTNKTLGASVVQASNAAPAFSAYLGSNQSVSASTYTKVQCDTEEFDTNSNYDNATNYRFTPTVAGYYQVNGAIDVGTSSITAGIAVIYKNGSAFKFGVGFGGSTLFTFHRVTVSALVYLNGSSDYVELYGYVIATTPIFYGASSSNYFQAAMIRSA